MYRDSEFEQFVPQSIQNRYFAGNAVSGYTPTQPVQQPSGISQPPPPTRQVQVSMPAAAPAAGAEPEFDLSTFGFDNASPDQASAPVANVAAGVNSSMARIQAARQAFGQPTGV